MGTLVIFIREFMVILLRCICESTISLCESLNVILSNSYWSVHAGYYDDVCVTTESLIPVSQVAKFCVDARTLR